MSEENIFRFSLNEEGLKDLYLTEVQKHLENIEMDTMLLDSKQLCKMLNLSWPTIEKLFLNDPDFPKIRVGKKWVFNRREVQAYIDSWSIEIREQGGRVNI
jgi:predicted DNA-binding transcriptional regulator AlpA